MGFAALVILTIAAGIPNDAETHKVLLITGLGVFAGSLVVTGAVGVALWDSHSQEEREEHRRLTDSEIFKDPDIPAICCASVVSFLLGALGIFITYAIASSVSADEI